MGSSKDYYSVLELDKKADVEAIKKAYRRLALKFHPDRNKGNEKESEEKFREIHEAYANLSDPQKRQEYDAHGANGASGARNRPTHQTSADAFNAFNSFFGGGAPPFPRAQFFSAPRPAFGPGFRPSTFPDFGFHSSFRSNFDEFDNAPQQQRYHKIKTKMKVGFRDSVLGCSQQYSLEHATKCSICSGTGASSGRVHDTICSRCGGSGRMRDVRGGMIVMLPCSNCAGFGRKNETPCQACNGTAKFSKIHKEEIVIPPGIGTGSTIKRIITPEGEDGEDGEPYELTIEFQVETHPFFKRKGIDVHVDVPITYTQAVLGDTIQVPSIYGGTTELKIPQGSQPMGEFVLVGQGFFNLEGNGQGDMVIRWILEVPKVLSPHERAVLSELSQLEQGSLPEKRIQFLQFMCDWDAESS